MQIKAINKRMSPVYSPRQMKFFSLIAIVTTVLGMGFFSVQNLRGSGISTHFEAADRSTALLNGAQYPELQQLLVDHAPVYRTGAVYPDWGYLFDATSDAAEAAHWAPFHTVGLEYMDEIHPQPWDLHQEQLFTLLAGMVCHGAMDDVWHFGSTSFLNQAIANDLPNKDRDIAELVIEVLTDIFVQVEHRPGTENVEWWLPIDDLVAISARAGYPEATSDQILLGSAIQKVGAILEDRLAHLAYPLATQLLPWTHANYLQWWDGGVVDGAEFSARQVEAYWDEWVILSQNRPKSGESDLQVTPHSHGHSLLNGCRSLAREFLSTGAVSVEIRQQSRGTYVLGPVIIQDSSAVDRQLMRFIQSFWPE